MATKIILIRHTSTRFNAERRYCGSTDIDISTLGKRQLMKLSRYCKKKRLKVDKVFSSDLKRAITCARGIFGDNFEIMRDFREMNFGLWEGLTHDEIMREYPRAYKVWLAKPFKARIPKGETFSDFKKRVSRGLNYIMKKHPDNTVAVVCHGGTIKLILSALIGKKENFWEVPQDSGAINIIECKDGRLSPVLINDISYYNEK